MPDATNGYYRGSRFDWSGNIYNLTYKGHSFFGKWFPRYDPRLHDAIMGPVEAFAPVGFESATPGEPFLKVGIGILQRTDTAAYSIVPPYPILNGGVWKSKAKKNEATFNHILKDSNYAYDYTKTITLIKGKPRLQISHILINKGKLPISTDVYDHNFFMFDSMTTGPDHLVTLQYSIVTDKEPNDTLSSITGNQLTFTREFKKGQHVYFSNLAGFSQQASDYDIRVENKATATGVRITCDRPLLKLAFWAASTTACPEPFIKIDVQPGSSFSWTLNYDFYLLEETPPTH